MAPRPRSRRMSSRPSSRPSSGSDHLSIGLREMAHGRARSRPSQSQHRQTLEVPRSGPWLRSPLGKPNERSRVRRSPLRARQRGEAPVSPHTRRRPLPEPNRRPLDGRWQVLWPCATYRNRIPTQRRQPRHRRTCGSQKPCPESASAFPGCRVGTERSRCHRLAPARLHGRACRALRRAPSRSARRSLERVQPDRHRGVSPPRGVREFSA